MSLPLLTIAIPTYNRASRLEHQLAWASSAIAERWEQVELLVSNNASTDATAQVCQHWIAKTNGRLRVFNQASNLGFAGNCAFCIRQARGEYVWLISDDDRINDDVLDWLLKHLSEMNPAMALLGHLATDGHNGPVIHDLTFPKHGLFEDGKSIFVYFALLTDYLLFVLTGGVYKTKFAQQAIDDWPEVTRNMHLPMYLKAHVATRGSVLVYEGAAFTQAVRVHSEVGDVLIGLYRDLPRVYWQLLKVGYGSGFVRRQILIRAGVLGLMLQHPVKFIQILPLYLQASRLSRRPLLLTSSARNKWQTETNRLLRSSYRHPAVTRYRSLQRLQSLWRVSN